MLNTRAYVKQAVLHVIVMRSAVQQLHTAKMQIGTYSYLLCQCWLQGPSTQDLDKSTARQTARRALQLQ